MTGEGPLTVHKPQVREVDEPFQSQILTAFTRRSEQLDALMPELYVRGLSQEDISQTLREKLGLEKVSPSAVSRVSQKLVEDFRRWHRRSLTIHSILYLFLDAFYLGLRSGGKRKTGILVAYGITREGKKILLDLTVGERESYEAWRVFLDDLKEHGLNEPLLVVVDGNAGLLRAVRECWPSSLRQRCQVHKMRNVLAKLPRRVQGEMKGMIQRIFTADSYESALRRGKELIARYQDAFPEAMACLEKDLEECLTCLRFPAEHRPRIRTTDESVKGLVVGGERGVGSQWRRVTPDRRAGPGDESPAARVVVQELKVALPWWHPRPLGVGGVPSAP